ncbi:isochorismatase domain-containing protein 2 isoform X2 [Mobula birostris]|uniref:isochorismatase domain-containing protein 2 isoform X2 n=1 Tax=Mobula birostris TaxID=1983395 RepID=UPI003B284F62
MSSHKVGKLVARTCALFLCDMQEKFRQSVVYFPQIVSVAARMLEGARALEIPTIITEQYPQGLGPTVPELGAQDLRKISKTCFSMLCPEVERELDALPGLQSVLLCGIETQACIMVPVEFCLLELPTVAVRGSDGLSLSTHPSASAAPQWREWKTSSSLGCRSQTISPGPGTPLRS